MTTRWIIPAEEWRIWSLYGNGVSLREVRRTFPHLGTEEIGAKILAVHEEVEMREANRVSTYWHCHECLIGTNYRYGCREFEGKYYCLQCGLKRWLEVG